MDSLPSAGLAPPDPPVATASDRSIKVVRKRSTNPDGPTEGSFLFDDKRYFSLELPWHEDQPDVSCIPVGSYTCVLAYSNRYQRLMPRLLNVPGRDGILIHPGNTVKDTKGCILIGTIATPAAVYNSQNAFAVFYEWMGKAWRDHVVQCQISYEPEAVPKNFQTT